MTPEHELVPYQSAELPPGPWLVFAPHPDDETFGMGGSLLRASGARIATHVIVMTDGARGGAAGADPRSVVAARRREVGEATTRLGVTSLELRDEPDRGLTAGPAQVARARRAILDIRPGTVFFPAPLELHPDHRSAAQIVWRALQTMAEAGDRLPRAWAYEISVQSPVNRLLDITAVREGKNEAMQCYASQNELNSYPDVVLALNRSRCYTLPEPATHAEGFFEYSEQDLRQDLRQATERHLVLYW